MNSMKKALVVYFSYTNGNTKHIAEKVQKVLAADIAELKTKLPYSRNYNQVVSQAQKEVKQGYMPEIQPLKYNPADYDVIVIGTPTWWYTMAPAIKTFLTQNDFTGKTVVPFMTNAGWPGHTIHDMKALCKNAHIVHEKEFKFDSQGGSTMETPEQELSTWIESLKDCLRQPS
jgi:flavodoxin